MAQFRGTIRGSRGSTSRLGGKESGLHITADGWDIGVEVRLYQSNGKDTVAVHLTGGSHGKGGRRLLGRFVEGEPVTVCIRETGETIRRMVIAGLP